MQQLKIDVSTAEKVLGKEKFVSLEKEAAACLQTVKKGDGAGNDFLGWVNLPQEITSAQLDDIKKTAASLSEKCETVVVIGIGGSYLGAKAVIESLKSNFPQPGENRTEVVFAGQNIGEDYLYELINYLDGRRYGIIVISKSGTTTEPAIAFRLLKEKLESKIGRKAAAEVIVAVTDPEKGALRKLADEEGYRTFPIAGNVGGRYSVLTPVGLLPIAVAGYDIAALVEGARAMQAETLEGDAEMVRKYAAARNGLYRDGKKIEILINFTPSLHFFGEWWKQLYGESEGKDHKGIFPAAADFTTDLHSMGQWIQQGERTIFETLISVGEPRHELVIPSDAANLDGLNFLAGKRVDEVNKMAQLGTRIAHEDGGVPVLKVTLPQVDEFCLGELIYFFEAACGTSGYMLGVNPFDQPGVEAYKKNMFALLDKPGYEAESEAIRKKING